MFNNFVKTKWIIGPSNFLKCKNAANEYLYDFIELKFMGQKGVSTKAWTAAWLQEFHMKQSAKAPHHGTTCPYFNVYHVDLRSSQGCMNKTTA